MAKYSKLVPPKGGTGESGHERNIDGARVALRPLRVVSRISFTDAKTGKSYIVGEEVHGWDEERIAEYIRRGVVAVFSDVGPSELKGD